MIQFGVAMVMQNAHDQLPDRESYERDMYLATLLEPLGFDRISVPEHHFDNYSMSPDNVAFLCWLAGKTTKLQLLVGAFILPWNTPVRVVERMLLLDNISNGRGLMGFGRGLAKREYEAFGLDMNEARGRFDEAARMVVKGVETGVLEGDGPFYPQKRINIRPGPVRSFKDRTFCVAMSSDSIPICAEIGAQMMIFAQQKSWTQMIPHFEAYRQGYREHHNSEAPIPTITEFMFCDESADRAEDMAQTYIGEYFDILTDHYETKGEHFGKTKGYGGYAEAAEKARNTKHSDMRADFVKHNNHGTPNQILETYWERRKIVGEFNMHVNVSYSGMSRENAEASMRLYAEKVIPEVRSWK